VDGADDQRPDGHPRQRQQEPDRDPEQQADPGRRERDPERQRDDLPDIAVAAEEKP
jgi:hypothetical protein